VTTPEAAARLVAAQAALAEAQRERDHFEGLLAEMNNEGAQIDAAGGQAGLDPRIHRLPRYENLTRGDLERLIDEYRTEAGKQVIEVAKARNEQQPQTSPNPEQGRDIGLA
jgi:hypothetical protein